MTLNIFILVGIITIVFVLKNKVDKIQKQIEERVEDFNALVADPVKRAAQIAGAFINKSRDKK